MQYESKDGRRHDSLADARYSDYQDELVGMGAKIMGGSGYRLGSSSGGGSSGPSEVSIAEAVNPVVDNYCNGNWDAVIKAAKSSSHLLKYANAVYALVVIAYAEKGNVEKALTTLVESFNDSYSENEYFSDNTKKVLDEWKFEKKYKEKEELLMKRIEQAYSKAHGREENETFTQFCISLCEKGIRDEVYLSKYRWVFKWQELTGRYLTKGNYINKEEIKRIAGGNVGTYKDLLSYFRDSRHNDERNTFVSVLFGIVAGLGATLTSSWLVTKYLDGFNFPIFFSLIIFIPICTIMWRRRWDIPFYIVLAFGIPGWITLFGGLSGEKLSLAERFPRIYEYISLFGELIKEIKNELK